MAEGGSVILSIVGYNKRDPTGVFLLDKLLTEQLQRLVSAKVLHVILEDHQKVQSESKDKIGFKRPIGFSTKSEPSVDWLNYFSLSFYAHLGNYRVTHILAYAPDFGWAAVNIKHHFFPNASMILVVHKQINDIGDDSDEDSQPGKDLAKWSEYAETMVSLGQHTYDDVENTLFALDKSFEKHKKLCYLPSPPEHFKKDSSWAKPPTTQSPVVLVLASDLLTQQKHDFNLPTVTRAITSVAEELYQSRLVRKIIIRLIGIPASEKSRVEASLKDCRNNYVRLEFQDCGTLDAIEHQLKLCSMCILPLGCASDAYGLEVMIPTTYGVPTLVPDSASIITDAEKIISTTDHCHLQEIKVQVMEVKSEEEEISAWRQKIKSTLIRIDQVQKSAATLRQAIINSEVLKTNSKDLVNLLEVSAKDKPATQPVSEPPPPDIRPCSYQSSWVIQETLDPRQQSTGHYEETAAAMNKNADKEQDETSQAWTKVDNATLHVQNQEMRQKRLQKQMTDEEQQECEQRSRLIMNWVDLVRTLEIYPLIDIMLAQKSINYEFYEKVTSVEKREGRAAGVRELLNLLRRKGELGTQQLAKALRDRNINCAYLAEKLDPE